MLALSRVTTFHAIRRAKGKGEATFVFHTANLEGFFTGRIVHLVNALASSSSQPETREETLFAAIDGHDIRGGGSRWLARVHGIHTERDEAWIQIALVGRLPCSLIVHLLPRTDARQAVAAINAWADTPAADRPRILDVG